MRVFLGCLALLMAASACSSERSPRRERRSRDAGREQAPSREDDLRAVIAMTGEVQVGRQDVHETLGDVSDLLQQLAPPEARGGRPAGIRGH